ncbi:hypothetical protein [Flavobacterium olei]|uniref:hypothetical protein n=1 Tax=Flavobacterium olei TaxID=1886782 RepID=UPI00321ABEDA
MNRLTPILILTISFFMFSCKNETKKDLSSKKYVHATFNINFPDTVDINKYYEGKIYYKSDLDTITTVLNEIVGKKSRMIEYSFVTTKLIVHDDEKLKKLTTDTMFTKSNRFIPLFTKFDKLGINYIDGIIKDEVWIDTIEIINNRKEKRTRIITNEFRATKKVFVISNRNKI